MHGKQMCFTLVLSTMLWAQSPMPPGSILAVRLNSSLTTRKTKEGQLIVATLMQSIPNSSVRKGAKVVGHILKMTPFRTGHPAEMSLRFDSVRTSKLTFAVTTDLRALASAMDVEDAQIPPTGPDRGTPWAWATRNLVGGEVAYGEGGPVASGVQTVGRALADGVLVDVRPNSTGGCRGETAGNAQPQALWVFSSDACGIYGFENLNINHAGRSANGRDHNYEHREH